MSMIGFPLLLIPLAIYNIFVFLMPGVPFTSPVVNVALMSGVVWTPTFGDTLITLAIILLLFEVIKASRPGARYLTDHLLSLIVFGGAAAEFLLLTPLGTSDFFQLTVLTGVEFVAGVVIGLRNRRLVTVPRSAAPVRQEPEMSSPVPERPHPPEPKRSEINSPDAKPPEMASMSPAPAAVVAPVVAGSSVLERKVSDWSMSELIADKDPTPGADGSYKSDAPDVPKP